MFKKMKEKGQSSIEFIIIFSFAIGFFIVFLGLGINMTLGYLVHYGTYEASRVYLAKDGATQDVIASENFAIREVERLKAIRSFGWPEVFKDSQFKMESPSGFLFNKARDVIPEFVGVHFRYKRRLSDYGFLTGNQRVDYVSESFLGKEPLRAECLERICQVMGGACGTFEVTAFDNGC